MSATIKFMREYTSLTITEILRLADEAIPSLEFHENFDFLKLLIDVLSEKLPELSEDSHKLAKSESNDNIYRKIFVLNFTIFRNCTFFTIS